MRQTEHFDNLRGSGATAAFSAATTHDVAPMKQQMVTKRLKEVDFAGCADAFFIAATI
jgi:hypothetical protein